MGFELPYGEWGRVFPVLAQVDEPRGSWEATASADGAWRGVFTSGGFAVMKADFAGVALLSIDPIRPAAC